MVPEQKEQRLIEFLSRYRTALVAFSGGVDSAYLAFVAHQTLQNNARAVTAISPSVSSLQKELAESFARRHRLNHCVVHTQEMDNPEYRKNPSNRCYFCKSELYSYLERLREQWGVEVIFDGSNADDVGDYRPGRQAAQERNVVSPLIQAGLTKADIRSFSRQRGLETWDLPAMPCLSSRFPYGVAISEEKLRQVDQAESVMRRLGFRNFRVRHHESLARIEVDRSEMARVLEMDLLEEINRELKALGYHYVTLDLQGFRSGSLNELLNLEIS